MYRENPEKAREIANKLVSLLGANEYPKYIVTLTWPFLAFSTNSLNSAGTLISTMPILIVFAGGAVVADWVVVVGVVVVIGGVVVVVGVVDVGGVVGGCLRWLRHYPC
jgi:hypothetical protein